MFSIQFKKNIRLHSNLCKWMQYCEWLKQQRTSFRKLYASGVLKSFFFPANCTLCLMFMALWKSTVELMELCLGWGKLQSLPLFSKAISNEKRGKTRLLCPTFFHIENQINSFFSFFFQKPPYVSCVLTIPISWHNQNQ